MKLGKINDLLPDIKMQLHFAGSTLVPQTEESGEPCKGELLKLAWNEIRDQPVALTIKLPQSIFVDTVVLETEEHTRLTAAVLTDGNAVLYRYCAETGKTVTEHVLELEAGVETDTLEVQLESFFSGITVKKLEIYGAMKDGGDLLPIPKKASTTGKTVPAEVFTAYCTDSDIGWKAGVVLAEKFLEKTGVELKSAETGDIRFETRSDIPADGYALQVENSKAVVAASNLRGMVCGAECFIKLIKDGFVQEASVTDSPDRPFRGVHLFLPAREHMAFAKRLVKYLLSPMGYNTVILEVGAGMRFDRHPELNTAYEEAIEKGRQGIWPQFPHSQVAGGQVLEKEEVREYVEYIRSFGIEVVPEIQSLGHVQYMTLAHPEIAEREEKDYNKDIDTRDEDSRPAEFYAHCYCPSNEKSYTLLFDIMDEIIDVFQPGEYVHMGHDEVYQMGLCPICKTKDPAQLLAQDINRIHSYLAAKGLKMMIWSDMFQPCTQYKTHASVDWIPKDILMLDFIWYFHMQEDLEDNLLEKGFQVAVGNLYSSHYPRYEKRMAKKGMVGGQISMWVGTNEEELQQEGKFFDFFKTAEMLWNADRYQHFYHRTYDQMISQRMPQLREELRQIRYPSRNTEAKTTVLIENPITFPPVNAVQKTEFAVSDSYDSLVFYHTCLRKLTRSPWKKHDVVGVYVLRYTDGSEEQIPVTSGGNVGYWNRRQNDVLKHAVYRHNGYTSGYYTDGIASKTADGGDVTVYRLEHLLPTDKVLSSVELRQIPEMDGQVFLCKAEGIKV